MTAAAPRTFTFTTVFATAIPEDVLKAQAPVRDTANDLPFKAWFDGNEKPVMEEGKLAVLFVPFSYFSTPADKGGRGVDAEKVDGAYVKAKLRDQFNSWQGKTKVVVSEGVYEKKTAKNKATGKEYEVRGKVITPEVSHNVARGAITITMMERSGKEKNLAQQKELGMTEPGVQLWMQALPVNKAKEELAKAQAEANATKA